MGFDLMQGEPTMCNVCVFFVCVVLLSDHKEALTGHSAVRRPHGGLSWFVFCLTVCQCHRAPCLKQIQDFGVYLTGKPLNAVKEDSPTNFQGKWRLRRQWQSIWSDPIFAASPRLSIPSI